MDKMIITFTELQMEQYQLVNRRVNVLYTFTKVNRKKLATRYTDNIDDGIRNSNNETELAKLYKDKSLDMFDEIEHVKQLHSRQYLVILCETWENLLVGHFNDALNESFDYGKIQKFIKQNVALIDDDMVEDLDTLKNLVRVIKHRDRKAVKWLKDHSPVFLKRSSQNCDQNKPLISWDPIEIDGYVLNIPDYTFYQYYEVIDLFWELLPRELHLDKKDAN